MPDSTVPPPDRPPPARRGPPGQPAGGARAPRPAPAAAAPPAGAGRQKDIHVVAGVISDARGRILLARRPDGTEEAGLWEFPGGKVEPDETPEAALARELQEELGITVDVGDRLIEIPLQMPTRILRLDVRRIRGWSGGQPHGCEGQALAWVQPDKLHRYHMPAPDRPAVAALLQPDRCLVTPEPVDGETAWLDALQTALASGIRRVQFRVHGLDPARRRSLLQAALKRCRRARAELLVNADAALAGEFGLGLHLRASQLREYRERPVEPGLSLSASCHDPDELALAQALGCDFVIAGPVRPTATHPGHPGIGWDGFESLRRHAPLPIYAIGGLTPGDIAEARRHGAQGIAAIRGLWG